MTRHTRNRQMVEVNRLNPKKRLHVRQEMGFLNVSMKSVYAEPKVWDLDPNFHAERLNVIRITHRKGDFAYRTNKRIIDKHRKQKHKEIYEQLNHGDKYPVFVVYNEDGTPHFHAMTYRRTLKTVYYHTVKQPHISGNGNYFNRILGVTKRGERYYSSKDLPRDMVGLFDEWGYRLVRENNDGTFHKTW